LPDEIIVVDDGSEPATTLPADPHGPEINLLRNAPPQGAAAARNRGWRATSSEYVLFTDDDCRPTPKWIDAMLSAARTDLVLVGRTIPDPDDGEEMTPFDRSVKIERCDGGFLTCNILYPRHVLEELGGFDERFRLLGEDTDLGQRALQAGCRGGYAQDALVYHAIERDSLRGRLRERRRITDIALLSTVHPQLRKQLWLGRFVSRDHRLLTAGLLGAPIVGIGMAGAVRRGRHPVRRILAASLAGAAMLPTARYVYWLGRRGEHLAGDGKLANSLGWIALDVIEIAFLAKGSVQHRTLLL
jgi:GT2 family glycosyltransferase